VSTREGEHMVHKHEITGGNSITLNVGHGKKKGGQCFKGREKSTRPRKEDAPFGRWGGFSIAEGKKITYCFRRGV